MKTISTFFAAILFIFLVSFISTDNSELTRDILKFTNKFRESKKLPDLIMREELNAIAQKHSYNMASGRIPFGHAGFAQRSALIREKLNVDGVAENVAFGPRTAKDAVDLWKSSPEHRKNMLGHYKYIGIGTAIDRKGYTYFTQIFAY